MSKPVKKLIREELVRRLAGVTQLAVVELTGVDANDTNEIRTRLHGKEIRLMVVKNSLARQAFRDLGIEAAGGLLDGPSALAFGADSVVTVVRELLDIHKETPSLTVKAAFLEGEIFQEDQIDALSKYPTRGEAVAQVVQCLLSPGANVAGCLVGPGGQIGGILKAIEEKEGGAEGSEAAGEED
jgi:large subunit ribosomal protein L10